MIIVILDIITSKLWDLEDHTIPEFKQYVEEIKNKIDRVPDDTSK